MKIVDMKEYYENFKKCSEVSNHECYTGEKKECGCYSCMYCFPGHYSVSVKNYDHGNICKCCKK